MSVDGRIAPLDERALTTLSGPPNFCLPDTRNKKTDNQTWPTWWSSVAPMAGQQRDRILGIPRGYGTPSAQHGSGAPPQAIPLLPCTVVRGIVCAPKTIIVPLRGLQ